jgi:hypothetical protein
VSAVTWAVEADFDLNASYETDLTGDIELPGSGITIDRGFGKDGIYQISKVSIVVSNRSGTYSYGNSASALYGKIKPGVPIRVTATHDAVSYAVWTGYIQSYKVSGVASGQVPTCTLECTDLADYLAQFNPINVLLDTRTTAEAYTAIAVAAGLDPGDYNFGGIQSLPLHWVRNSDALTAMAQVQQSEMGGQWYIDADGVIQGESRAARLGISVDQTWGDGTSIMPKAATVEITDADLISEASVQANIFVADADEQLIFEFSRNATNPTPDSIAILAGETYGPVGLDYPTIVESVAVQVAGEDYTANSTIDGSGTDMTSDLEVTNTEQGAGFELTLKNTHATDTLYVTKFTKKGLAQNYVPDRPVFRTGLAIPGDKIARGITVQLPFADDTNTARNFSVALARTWRYEYPRLTLAFDSGSSNSIVDAAKKVAMLSLELGNQIKYTDTAITTITKTYSDDWWYVEHIRHAIPPNMVGEFQTTVTMIPSYLFRNLDAIAFDHFTRDNATGDLGESTSGHTWANDGNMDIVSNAARANSDVLQLPNLDLGAGITDQVVEVSLGAVGAGDEVGVTFRHVDANNQYRAYIDKGSNEVILEKNVAGVVTEISSPAFTVGTTHEIRAIVQSTRIRVWVDRFLYIDTTDAALSAGTRVGLFARTANATTTFSSVYGQGLDA